MAPLQVALLFGTRAAETILASVHVRTRQQAGHMNASDLIQTLQKRLVRRGPSTYVTWLYCFIVGSLFAAHLIGFAAISPVCSRPLDRLGPMIRWTAGASFTLYLVHQPIMFCLAALSPWRSGSVPRLLFVGLGTLLIIVVVAELGERRKRAWQLAITTLIDWVAARRLLYRPIRKV
jgi:peptidoglycan/LPS O-acetylase OafA/YrhL